MNKRNKVRKFLTKIKTLRFVRDAVLNDMNKISKKCKEYDSLNERFINLSIAMHQYDLKLSQIAVDSYRSIKNLHRSKVC